MKGRLTSKQMGNTWKICHAWAGGVYQMEDPISSDYPQGRSSKPYFRYKRQLSLIIYI